MWNVYQEIPHRLSARGIYRGLVTYACTSSSAGRIFKFQALRTEGKQGFSINHPVCTDSLGTVSRFYIWRIKRLANSASQQSTPSVLIVEIAVSQQLRTYGIYQLLMEQGAMWLCSAVSKELSKGCTAFPVSCIASSKDRFSHRQISFLFFFKKLGLLGYNLQTVKSILLSI